MIRKIIDIVRWNINEILGKKTISEIYDWLALGNKYETLINYKRRLRLLKKAIFLLDKDYHDVLDIACGTGVFIDAFENKAKLRITGVDISKEMLGIAQKRFSTYPNIKLQHKDFMKSSFPSNSFDLITISNSIRFVPSDKEKEFEDKVASWLRPKGTFLIVQTLPIYDWVFMPFMKRFYKGFNVNFHQEKNLSKIMSSKFLLYKEVVLGTETFIQKTKAYYFRKK